MEIRLLLTRIYCNMKTLSIFDAITALDFDLMERTQRNENSHTYSCIGAVGMYWRQNRSRLVANRYTRSANECSHNRLYLTLWRHIWNCGQRLCVDCAFVHNPLWLSRQYTIDNDSLAQEDLCTILKWQHWIPLSSISVDQKPKQEVCFLNYHNLG